MIGGDGTDFYVVDSVGDVVTETNNNQGSGGRDWVDVYLTTYTLTANVERGRLMLGGAGALIGNDTSNVLYSGTGDNVLDGGNGSDWAYYALGITTSGP